MKRFGVLILGLLILFILSGFGLENKQTLQVEERGPGLEAQVARQREIVRGAIQTGRDSTLIAREVIGLGNYYTRLELYSEAMVQLSRALGYMGSQASDSLKLYHANSLAGVYIGMEDYDLARKVLGEALEGFREGEKTPGVERSMGLLGVCAEKSGAYLEALEYQKKSLELYRSKEDRLGESTVHQNMGSIYEDLGQYDLAFAHFEKAYAYLEGSIGIETANVLNNLGDVLRKQGAYAEALGFTSRALEIARQLDDKHQLESAHKDLSKIYAATGEYARAYEHLRESNRQQEEARASQNRSQLNVLQTLYETEKKESEIQLLREQNKVSSSQQKVLAVSVGALLLLLATTLVMARKKRLSDKRLQYLKEKALKAELDRKELEEANLQREINLKSAALTRYSLNLSHKNKVLIDLSKSLSHMAGRQHMDFSGKMRSLVREIDHTLNQDGEWDEFMHIFEEIHPDFMKKLNDLAEGSLSSSELRLAMLLRLNLSSKEIASILRVTPDSVRVARYRLRKKLPIPHKKELANYMVEL